MAEKAIVNYIMREARKRGWFAMKNHGSPYTTRGFPDLTLLIPAIPWAMPVFIEVKASSKQALTKSQIYWLSLLNNHMGMSFAVQGRDEAIDMLNTLDDILEKERKKWTP